MAAPPIPPHNLLKKRLGCFITNLGILVVIVGTLFIFVYTLALITEGFYWHR